jgi:hypothetical protein
MRNLLVLLRPVNRLKIYTQNDCILFGCVYNEVIAARNPRENQMKTIFLVDVKTENGGDGCFHGAFDSLDEVREFIKARAASFRVGNPQRNCHAFILRSGTPISAGRTVAC